MLTAFTAILLTIGGIFFILGLVGVIRLPDLYCRLHALTKADNAGLGFIVTGMMLQAQSLASVLQLLLVWLLVLLASAGACSLVARHALLQGIEPKCGKPND